MITINMNIAKDIWRDKIRSDRHKVFQQLDIEFLKSIEDNNLEQQQIIKEKKQYLRNATLDPRIEQSSTPEQLLMINPIEEIQT